MKKPFFQHMLFWSIFTVLIVAAFFLQFALIGYRFLALVCIGIAGLMLCFKGLKLLSEKEITWAKVVRKVLLVVVILFTVAAGITGVCIALNCGGNPNTQCEYVIVLGAGVHGNTPSLSLRSRIDAAYQYLSEHPDAVAVVSGGKGSGENISEAQCMCDHLVAKGIAPDRIWMEDKSTSTRENLHYSLALIENRTGSPPESINILSNEFHLLRATLMAKEEGVTAYGIPARTPLRLLFVTYFLREIAALWNYWIFGG